MIYDVQKRTAPAPEPSVQAGGWADGGRTGYRSSESRYQERRASEEGEGVLHPWKTTQASSTEINIAEGKVFTQAGFSGTTAAAVEEVAVSASGYAICSITRNTSSRTITGAVISYVTGTPAASDYTTQIVRLAQVIFTDGAIEDIIQLQFNELHILEDQVVVNGEFQLADVVIGSNIYDLPP